MRILAISGSLRARSSNAAILRAVAAVAPAGVGLDFYEGLGALPHFNPDLDGEGAIPPPPVAEARARLAAADAVLICSPEYARGVPGALKNLLDWMVSVIELIDKPVAVIGVSPSGCDHALPQLLLTLRTMSWRVAGEASISISLGRAQLDDAGELADPEAIERLRRSLAALVAEAAKPAGAGGVESPT